jgi:hypothetical protein
MKVCFLNLKTWWFFLEQDVPNANFIRKLDLKHKIADNILNIICVFKCNSPIIFLCCCKIVLAYGKMLSWLLNNHWASLKLIGSFPNNWEFFGHSAIKYFIWLNLNAIEKKLVMWIKSISNLEFSQMKYIFSLVNWKNSIVWIKCF